MIVVKTFSLHTKFEMSSLSCSKDIVRAPKLKMGHGRLTTPKIKVGHVTLITHRRIVCHPKAYKMLETVHNENVVTQYVHVSYC